MAAVRFRFRTELRTRWRAWLALAVLVGLVGGAVLALIAGARRTDSAYGRFLRAHAAYDIIVVSEAGEEQRAYQSAVFSADELRGLPHVADVAPAGYFYVVLGAGVGALLPPDERIGTEVNRFKLLDGRRPDARDPTEAVVGFALAEEQDLRVGSEIPVLPSWILNAGPGELPPETAAARRRVLEVLPGGTVTVVGIAAAPGQFPPQVEGDFRFLVHLSPALYPHRADLSVGNEGGEATMVRLQRGERDMDAFLDALRRAGGGLPPQATVQRENRVAVERSIHTQAVALWLLALLTAAVGGVVAGQLLARLTVLESDENPALSALGMDRGQLVALGLARAVAIGSAGAVVAAALALALSRAFPTGLAAIAEPDPGWRLDAPVLALGAPALVLVVAALAARPVWRSSRTARRGVAVADQGVATTRLGRALGWPGLPVPAFAGVRMALSPGRGRSAVPVRSSLAAMTVGVVALVATLSFGASLEHLLDTPRLYGKTWDVELQTYEESLATEGLAVLEADDRVTGLAVGYTRASFEIEGHRVDGMSVDTVKGGVAMTVVGRAVFPIFSPAGRLGDGAYLTRGGGRRVFRADEFENSVLVQLVDGVDVRDLDPRLAADNGVFVLGQGRPSDIVNFGRVEGTPYLLGGILAVLAAATLAHVLVTAIRRRRRELAVLQALGFDRGQVRATVLWQATALAAVTLIVGVPLGIAAGRTAWRLFADGLGVAVEPRVPQLALLAVLAGALALANLIAVVPATVAARTRAAETLRSE